MIPRRRKKASRWNDDDSQLSWCKCKKKTAKKKEYRSSEFE